MLTTATTPTPDDLAETILTAGMDALDPQWRSRSRPEREATRELSRAILREMIASAGATFIERAAAITGDLDLARRALVAAAAQPTGRATIAAALDPEPPR